MVGSDTENKRSAGKMDERPTLEMEGTEAMGLTQIEKRFLLLAERGDIASVKKILEEYQDRDEFDINCVDSLNRSALVAAIENENLDLIDVLLEKGIQVKDALLHAINEEYVEAVEVLLEWEESTHKENDPYSWEAVDRSSSNFTPDITPLILAAHVNNYEILKILLDRGATLPLPHEIRCACDECIASRNQDSLRHSQSRINSYRALTAPSLIALSSRDPLLTAFELSWDLRRMSRIETEFRAEYNEMRQRCQEFATALLDHTRTSYELEIMLNYDPEALPLEVWQPGDRQTLERLKLAIKYKQKQFVAHPNVQQLLAAIWYEGLPGFRRKGMVQQIFEMSKLGAMFPMYTAIYMMAPNSETGLFMKKPFVKFISHSASYSFFLMLLGMASQRVETLVLEWFGPDWVQDLVKEWRRKERGSIPGLVESVIILYIISLIWSEVRALWKDGILDYISDLWNIVDFITFSFYSAWIFMRATAVYLVHREDSIGVDPYYPREKWDMFDPMLLSEGAFAAGMIFSFLKLVHIFSVNPHLGPLQISLGRMIIDILKFFFIYTLVLFAFGCGLNQLLWYYAELEKKKCYHTPDGEADFDDQDRACAIWRRFSNLFETSQSLFWAGFGLVDLMNFELTGIKGFTRFWALLMFGSYSVINIIVLLNMLIAMMSNSYQIISERADTEWKFARSKLWMSYFEDGDTVPAPFNLLPTMKNITRIIGCRSGLKPTESMMRKSRGLARERYEQVMRLLVRRYVTAEQRKRDDFGITEDDVMEIRQDISTLRFELIDILKSNGMVTPNLKKDEASATGKKGRVMERRLLKDFQIGFVEGFLSDAMKAGTENKNIFSKLAKAIGKRASSSKGKDWNALVRKGTINQNPIGSTSEAQSRITRQSARRHILEYQKTPLHMDPEKLLQYNPKLSDISPAARVAYARFKISKIKNEFNRGETPDISRESSIKMNDFRPRTPIMEDQREGTISPTGAPEDVLVIVNEQEKPSSINEVVKEDSQESTAYQLTSIVETPPTPTEGSPGPSPQPQSPTNEPKSTPASPRTPSASPKPPLGPGWF